MTTADQALVVGLDTSLTGTGIADSTGWCTLVGTNGITKMPLLARIRAVDSLVLRILDAAPDADLYVIERPAYSRTSGGALERHALWWHLVQLLFGRGMAVAEVSIQDRMRYATGKAAATKEAVVDAVARRWPVFITNGDNNLADAAVLAAMGAHHLGFPLARMPETHRKALDNVDWPLTPWTGGL